MAGHDNQNVYRTVSKVPEPEKPPPIELKPTAAASVTRNRVLASLFLGVGFLIIAVWVGVSWKDLFGKEKKEEEVAASTEPRVLTLADGTAGYTGVFALTPSTNRMLNVGGVNVDLLLTGGWGGMGEASAGVSQSPFRDLVEPDPLDVALGQDIPAMLVRAATKFVEIRDFKEAEELLQKALKSQPDSFEALRLMGAVLTHTQRYAEAIEVYEALIRRDPFKEELRNNVAIAYLRTGHPAPAEEHLREAMSLNPNFVEARVNIGLLYLSQERFSDVITVLGSVPLDHPNLSSVRRYLAASYYALGDYFQSRTHYEHLVRIEPDSPDGYLHVSRCLARERNIDKSLAWLQLASDRASEAQMRAALRDPAFEPLYTTHVFRRQFAQFMDNQ